MKIDELRRLLREADRENLEKAFAESYKLKLPTPIRCVEP